MKVAIIHDWLLGMRGGERCLEVIAGLFPKVDIYTLFYDQNAVTEDIKRHGVFTSSLQKLPFVKKYYRALLPFYFIGIKEINKKLVENNYDLVISISHCVAKNVTVPKNTFHLCYCLTPVRYFWDQYDTYFSKSLFEPLIRRIIEPLRRWDVAAAKRVDKFLGISEFVVQRIRRIYQKDARVVYPPVRTDWIKVKKEIAKEKFFLCVNALVPYKNTDLIVQTFNFLKLPLIIVGTGPEEAKLKQLAKSNIKFINNISDLSLGELYRDCQALVFAAKEDFGMTPVEAQAAGSPVICYEEGGVLETVNFKKGEETGIGFSTLSVDSLANAVNEFCHRQDDFTVDNCVKQAKKFSLENFKLEFLAALKEVVVGIGNTDVSIAINNNS